MLDKKRTSFDKKINLDLNKIMTARKQVEGEQGKQNIGFGCDYNM